MLLFERYMYFDNIVLTPQPFKYNIPPSISFSGTCTKILPLYLFPPLFLPPFPFINPFPGAKRALTHGGRGVVYLLTLYIY